MRAPSEPSSSTNTPRRIHLRAALHVAEQRLPNGSPRPFSLTFVKLSTGEIRHCRATLTSLHTAGNTLNIRREGEEKPIKIYKFLLLSINNTPIYL